MYRLIPTMILLSLTFSAAIFGFFYAWVCSTLWGLDAADSRVAIGAMQAMNASVRNAVFAPAFFGTPILLGATAVLLWAGDKSKSAALFASSSAVYLCFGLLLTMAVNVPMNEALALVSIPLDASIASEIWREYSDRWQFWNQIRTVASGLAFLLAACGTLTLSSAPRPE